MARFLKKFLLWSVLALILVSLLDVFISRGLQETDQRKYAVWNDIYKGNAVADLVVIGSSRAWCGYNTFILDSLLHCNSYNLGIDGHPLDMQLIRYKTFRRFNPKPQIILLNTDYLSTLSISADPRYEREQFFPYFKDDELIDDVASGKHFSIAERYFPLYRYYGYRKEIKTGIQAFLGKKEFEDGGLYKGYRGNEYKWNRGSLDSNDSLSVSPIDSLLLGLLYDFAKQSYEEGIQVFFVKSPVYERLTDKFRNISISDSIFTEVSEKYNCILLDYYYSEISKDSTNFYNPSHLNKKGSEIFTRQLCIDLQPFIHPINKNEEIDQ
jgi:hypothetical protein